MRGVEIAPHRGRRTATGAAVQHHDRTPLGMAALFDINPVAARNIDQPLIEWFDLRIKKAACALLPCDPVHELTI